MKNTWATFATLAVIGAIGLGVTVAAVGATDDQAASYLITATMTAKQVVQPRPVGKVDKARGSLIGKATLATRSQVAWTLTYSGMTGRVVSTLVLFKNAKGVSTAISLCVTPCKSGLKSFTFFRSRGEGEYFVKQVLADKVEVILRTKRNPKGEIRGVLRARKV